MGHDSQLAMTVVRLGCRALASLRLPSGSPSLSRWMHIMRALEVDALTVQNLRRRNILTPPANSLLSCGRCCGTPTVRIRYNSSIKFLRVDWSRLSLAWVATSCIASRNSSWARIYIVYASPVLPSNKRSMLVLGGLRQWFVTKLANSDKRMCS